jgi:cytochrome P450
MLAMSVAPLMVIALVFSVLWISRIIMDLSISKQTPQSKTYRKTQTSQLWDILGIRRLIQIYCAVIQGNTLLYVDMLLDQYGDTYTMDILGTKVTITRDTSNIRSILKDQSNDYDAAKGVRVKMFKYLVPGTIAATDGKEWKENRVKWRHYVKSLDQMLDVAPMESIFQNFVTHISRGEAVDIQPLFVALTTDIIHEIAFGESTHCTDPQNQSHETRKYIEAVKRVTVSTARRGLLGPLSNLISERGYKADCIVVKDYIGRLIQKKLVKRQDSEESKKVGSSQRQTFLDRLLLFTENPIALNHDATTFVLASESVAGPLHSTIWLLSRNPIVYEKLRDSILGTIGYEKPSFEQLNELNYLRNVLQECKCISSL